MGLEERDDPGRVKALADRLEVALDLFWEVSVVVDDSDPVVDEDLEAPFWQVKIAQMGDHIREGETKLSAHKERGQRVIDVMNSGGVEEFDVSDAPSVP